MKTFTNYTPGLRGINLTDGDTAWIEPGQSIELDTKRIVGDVPDLGKAGNELVADGDFADLSDRVAELTKQVEELTASNKALEGEKAELTKQVEELTKPADPLDHDGDGKKGGVAPAKE